MSDMNTDAKAIFLEALDRKSREELERYLADACGDNRALRSRVEELLRAHQDAGNFLGGAWPQTATINEPITEGPGSVIGPYKLLQQIGEGGMGTVFMAEQTHPVQRKVAIKVIKPGMDSRQVIARFEAERQALAMMDHINIARVLDAGATESGRPYFVMELVHGVPITKYCDDNHLTPRERLELFVPVCQAIQHAHQKGIIHRDIKPSNVMITLYDGKPVPKVIDFGVAKATEQRLTERTLFTQYGTMVGTLEYMSPEQAEMSALGVDTRSDIYSLGVLLYELLTGSTPLTQKRVREAAFGEILRMIKEEEPPKPSTRLSESGEALASISAQRHTEPAKLAKLVRGELDWIVMKTLEKDRNRRYETVNGFAADVQRYLNDEPVQACPPSAIYRLRKFTRRNRAGLLTASLVGVALLVATSAIGWTIRDRSARQAEMERQRVAQQLEAERERAAARQQLEQERLVRQAKLGERISQALDETQVGYERDRLPDALTAVKRAEALLASDNGVSLELRQRVDQWRAELTILERLEELGFHFSREDSRETDAAYSKVFLDIGIDIDEMPVEEAGKRIRSHVVWQRVTEALDRWTGIRHEMQFLANSSPEEKAEASRRKTRLLQVARAADADDLRSQARLAVEKWDIKAALRLEESPDVIRLPASTLRQLAMLIYFGEGDSHRKRAVHLLENAQVQRPGDFQLATACATYYWRMEPPRWAEVAHYYSIAIALRPDDARVQRLLAHAYARQGKVDEAIEAYRRTIELDPKNAVAHANLGDALHEKDQLDEAIACYKKAIELDPKFARAWTNRGALYSDSGQLDKALADCSKGIELDPKIAVAWANRGTTYIKMGQLDKALADCSTAIELDPKYARAWANRGATYIKMGQLDKALVDCSKAIELQPDNALAHYNLGIALRATGDLDAAITEYRKAIELNPDHADAHARLGIALAATGDHDAAILEFRIAVELKPGDARTHYNLGLALGKKGLLDEAIAHYRKAIELKPDIPTAHNNLAVALNDFAWRLATCPDPKRRDPGLAVEHAKEAVERKPEEGNFWNTLGVAQYRTGDWKASLEALKKSDELLAGKEVSFNAFFLAMAHWQLDENDEARKWYDQAVEWMDQKKPQDEELKRFRAEASELLGVKEDQSRS